MESEVSSENLMLRFQKGDLDAFAALVNRHKHEVYNFCVRFIQDSHYADDLAQDVFVSLYRSVSDYRPTAPFRAYLFRIARNACLNHIKRQKRMVPFTCVADRADALPESDGSAGSVGFAGSAGSADNLPLVSPFGMPESTALRKEDAVNLCRVMARLTEKQRTALFLAHFHGLSYKEIAQVADCPIGTVRSRISAAYAALRRELADDATPSALPTKEERR